MQGRSSVWQSAYLQLGGGLESGREPKILGAELSELGEHSVHLPSEIAIRVQSEGNQRAIRGQSERNQSAIRSQSECNQRAIRGQ